MTGYLRLFELGNPIAIPNNISKGAFIKNQLLRNYILIITVLVLILFSIFVMYAVVVRSRNESTKLLIYSSGVFLFLNALVVHTYRNASKIETTSIFLFDNSNRSMKILDNINFKMLFNSIDYSQFSKPINHKISLFNIAAKNIKDSHAYQNINKDNQNDISKDSNKEENIYLTNPLKHGIINEKEENSEDKNIDIGVNPKNKRSKESCTPQALMHGQCNEHRERPSKRASTESNSTSTSSSAKATKSSTRNTPSEVNVKTHLNETKHVSAEKPSHEPIMSFIDQYINNTMKRLNHEFSQNKENSVYFNNINKSIKKLNDKTKTFDSDFKKFLKLSSNIENELKSFNSSTEGYNKIGYSMVQNLRKLNSLTNISENLNNRDNIDMELNKIFNKNEPEEEPNKHKKLNGLSKKSFHMYFLIFLILQFFLCLIFMASLLGKNEYILCIKIVLVATLLINLFSSLYFMVEAHFLDKDCILGNVPGCQSNYTSGIANFAASANLDLRNNNSAKLDKVSESFEKIQNKTETINSILKNFYEDRPIGKYDLGSTSLKFLFRNIYFVEEDFEDLVRKKISKAEYFGLIKSIENTMHGIDALLRSLNQERILNFYIQEKVFWYFIRNDKSEILKVVGDQIDKNNKESNDSNSKECVNQKNKLCKDKNIFDVISLMELFGSLAFMTCLIF